MALKYNTMNAHRQKNHGPYMTASAVDEMQAMQAVVVALVQHRGILPTQDRTHCKKRDVRATDG